MRVAQDFPNAMAFLTDEPAKAFTEFDLGGGVRPIAGLLL
jgi:hypothetical protein